MAMTMAMAVQGCTSQDSSIYTQEKGNKNKRKFRPDPPPVDLNTLAPPMLADYPSEYPGYDLFSFPIEKSLENPALNCHEACDLCAIPAYVPRDPELDLDEFQMADWGEVSESQLEEILLSNLDAIFKSAIKTITFHGYTEEVAMNAVLRSGICYGGKDTGSNIVENVLAFLTSGQEVDSSLRENFDEDLQKLEKNVLGEMVNVLREVRPFFSYGDAMWCLLISDMNVTHACVMESDPLDVIGNDDTSCSSITPQLESQANSDVSTSPTNFELKDSGLNKPHTVPPHPGKVLGIPNLPRGRFCASNKVHDKNSNMNSGKGESISSSVQADLTSLTVSQAPLPDEKRAGGRKSHAGVSKRDSALRKKSAHFEKSYRSFGSKTASRTGKHNCLGGPVLDKKCKSVSSSTVISMKSASLKLSKMIGTTPSQVSLALGTSFSDGSNVSASPLPTTNTELSLSLTSQSSSDATTRPSCTPGSSSSSNHLSAPFDNMRGHRPPQDKKDEILLKLVPRVRELQVQRQEWTEWAQKKVMQVAHRLNKHKVELQTLRQEKEEVGRLKKEKRVLEENTRKKLSEMEIALSKASSQVEEANAAARRLEFENAKLRLEMEAAKLEAAQSAASCEEVSKRETSTFKRVQSWEREKALVQEELTSGKRKLLQMQQQLEQAKKLYDQIQAKWKLEETTKNQALMQANSLRAEREQIQTAGKAKENAARLKAETESQRYRADTRRLEEQIAKLRLATDSSKMVALRSGSNGSYVSRLSENKRANMTFSIINIVESQEFGTEEIQRERECVMCLTEEITILFLPCAHQVVCTKCNELHEKQGMKDCPSCRTPILRRICIRSADSGSYTCMK